MDDPNSALALVLHANEHRVQRYAVNKRFRSVDGIQNPAKARVAQLLAEFLPEHGIVGKCRSDSLAQELLGPAIGHGDRRGIVFQIDLQIVALKKLQRNVARFVSNFAGQFQSRREFGIHDDKLADGSTRHEGSYDVVSID